MNVLTELKRPQSAVFTLQTLTPLYTGGIGQQGEQLHPSGLLGGIRRFSTLLAVALGDAGFETRVWGSTTEDRHAKQVALHWDVGDLEKITLSNLPIRIDDRKEHKGWFYNVAHFGNLRLRLTQRGISSMDDWPIVLRALRIQLNWATFGSRDQWGLGVLAPTGDLPPDIPLSVQINEPPDCPGLHHTFFARLEFDRLPPPTWRDRLEQGLRWRAHLRGIFRRPGEDDLRHYLFGHLAKGKNDNSQGGAVNVSALYPLEAERCALRIWGVIPHTQPQPAKFIERRAEIVQRIQAALSGEVAGATPARASRLSWEDGGAQTDLQRWISRLAGV